MTPPGADLHTHTVASDGSLAPAALVELAAAAGVGVLAVTDHDTLDGVPEALAAGEACGVRVIPGVELSVRAPSGSMHLLGYFRDPRPEPLAGRLAALRVARAERARRIVERLTELGAPIDYADVAARAGGAIGRPYLADGGPAYIAHQSLEPREAVRLVADSGGAPVLAHPASLRMSPRGLADFVRRLTGWGLRGIEVHRPEHTPERRAAFADLARRNRIVAAGGSDFHRPEDPLRPGDTGVPPLPPDAIDRLLG